MKKFIVVAALLMVLVSAGQAPDYPTAPAARTIVKAEYFFDTDPGPGNGTPINLTPATDIANLSATISLNGAALTNGFHRLYIRTQDDAGRWSLTATAFFDNVVVPPYPTETGTPGNITEIEYFIDTDPGLGNGEKIVVPPSDNLNGINALIDLRNIPVGAHRLYIRSKDASGKWSLTHYAVFDNSTLTPYPLAPPAAPDLTDAEYFFDTDPGFGNGTPITLPASTDVSNFSVNIPLNSLSQGPHTFYLRSKQNPWSLTAYAEFVIGSVLPVSWLYVKAETKGEDALITWATGTEQNADKFIIEYSRDGSHYQHAGEVAAKNNASGSSYSFRHVRPGNGVVYYRIRQTDKDGKHTYSKTMMLLFKEGIKTPVLFPNPASHIIHIAMPAGANAKSIEIYDASGRLVKRERLNKNQTVSVQINDLKKGRYVALIQFEKGRESLSFVKN